MEGFVVASLMFLSGAFTYWVREVIYSLKEIQKLLKELIKAEDKTK